MWKFTFYRDRQGEFRWRLKGGNGEIIATGEGHPRMADAVRSARNFRAKTSQAEIVLPRVARKRPTARRPQRSALDLLLSELRSQPR